MVLAVSSGAMITISGVLLAIGAVIVALAMRHGGARASTSSPPAPEGAEDGRARARPAAGAVPSPPKPRRVSLRAIVDRLIHVGDEETVHYDRRSGAFVTLGDQLRAAIESGEDIDDPIDFTTEQIAAIRQRMKTGEMIMLPTKAQTREFELQERFIHELPEDGTKENMLKVMRGQAGFRSFEGTVKRLGLEKRWRSFRDAAFAQIASDWCRKHGISVDADVSESDETRNLRRAS